MPDTLAHYVLNIIYIMLRLVTDGADVRQEVALMVTGMQTEKIVSS